MGKTVCDTRSQEKGAQHDTQGHTGTTVSRGRRNGGDVDNFPEVSMGRGT